MPIPESDISILVPTYRYRDKVVRAVESALLSGAGEIIVTDDCSRDGTIERLATYSDPRLIVSENECNLGLWENHLHALTLATRPWIKFIQADDYLSGDGLAAFARVADKDVAIVSCAPTEINDATGETMFFYHLSAPTRLEAHSVFDASLHIGWVLGRPSQVLLRSDAIERDPAAWRTSVSADVIVGCLAALRGNVVILPAGSITVGVHDNNEGKRASYARGLERMALTVEYLTASGRPEAARFARLWAAACMPQTLHTAAAGMLKERRQSYKCMMMFARLCNTAAQCLRRDMAGTRRVLWSAFRSQMQLRFPYDMDQLLKDLAARDSLHCRN